MKSEPTKYCPDCKREETKCIQQKWIEWRVGWLREKLRYKRIVFEKEEIKIAEVYDLIDEAFAIGDLHKK